MEVYFLSMTAVVYFFEYDCQKHQLKCTLKISRPKAEKLSVTPVQLSNLIKFLNGGQI